MKGLRGARVLLVDDKAEEAIPVINAFAKRGIGVAYFDGRPQGLPKKAERLKGVRLAVLDIDLGEGGVGNTVPATLVQRVARILSSENGPYAVILWTNHEEHRNKVEEYLFKHRDLPNPLFTEMITKAECRSGSSFSLDRVEERIAKALDSIGPLRFLQVWEGGCFDAATAVTNGLTKVTTQSGTDLANWRVDWTEGMNSLLRAVASAREEKQLEKKNCVSAVYTTLNPLHSDRMEALLPVLCSAVTNHTDNIMNAGGAVTLEQKARINSMLHLGLRDFTRFAPGNVYKFARKQKPAWLPSCMQLLDGFAQSSGSEKDIVRCKEDVCAGSFVIAVEISAACDFAQKKLQVARFLPGLLIPNGLINRINSSARFMKAIGPVFLDTRTIPKDIYHLFFSSRQVLSLKISRTAKMRPLAQLRSQGLADLQSWFSYQAGRQGITLLK